MERLPTTILTTFLCLAVAWDLRERRIPNSLVAAYALVGLGLAGAAGQPALGRAVAGMAEGLALLILPFAFRFVGGGDAKFFAAVGAFLGPSLTLWAFLFGTALGAPLAAVVLWRTRRTVSASPGVQPVPMLPYAVPLALGTLVAVACDWAGMAFG